MKKLDTNALFTQYLNVVNRALGEHRDQMPWKQVFELGEELLEDRRLGVAVYKTDASNPHDWFTVGIEDGTFRLLQHGKSDQTDIGWKVQESHLEEVVENPQKYVDNPLLLDLDWLRTRVKSLVSA